MLIVGTKSQSIILFQILPNAHQSFAARIQGVFFQSGYLGRSPRCLLS
jgi:hypothetical protein